MAYSQGEAHGQYTLFPATLDELIPQDHVCRVIEAFVGRLDMTKDFATIIAPTLTKANNLDAVQF